MIRFFMVMLLVPLSVLAFAGEWEVLNQGIGIDLEGGDFVNGHVGWIIGWGRLLKTEDGGENWFELENEDLDFSEIDFVNESVGWAIAYPAGRPKSPSCWERKRPAPLSRASKRH